MNKQTDQSPPPVTLGDGGVYSSLMELAKWDEALARPGCQAKGKCFPR
jgi:hypothetical protein